MHDLPRQKLRDLIIEYGRSLCDDPRRCEALLKDYCGQYKREIFVLVSALKNRVAEDLINASAGVPPALLLGRLIKRLEDELGLAENAARWAVESWARALGMTVASVERPRPVPEPPAVERRAREVEPSHPPAVPMRPTPPPVVAPPTSGRPSWAWIVVVGVFLLLLVGRFLPSSLPPPAPTPPKVQLEPPPPPAPAVPSPVPPPPAPATPSPAPVAFVEPEMVEIAGGRFEMGCGPGDDSCDNDAAQPRHRVTVQRFQIGKYEVTQGQWRSVVGDNPSEFKQGDNYPVENVSWNDIQTYLQKLSQKTGKAYRLPTEAEWEYAARAGTTTQYWWGDDVGRNRANCNGCGSQWDGKQTAPVGSFSPNPWGLYDTVGNVWEWTCSPYHKYGGAETKCVDKDTADARSVGGGSWSNYPRWVRAAYRVGSAPTHRLSNLGFRLARSL